MPKGELAGLGPIGVGVSADGVGLDVLRGLVDEQKAEPWATWFLGHWFVVYSWGK